MYRAQQSPAAKRPDIENHHCLTSRDSTFYKQTFMVKARRKMIDSLVSTLLNASDVGERQAGAYPESSVAGAVRMLERREQESNVANAVKRSQRLESAEKRKP